MGSERRKLWRERRRKNAAGLCAREGCETVLALSRGAAVWNPRLQTVQHEVLVYVDPSTNLRYCPCTWLSNFAARRALRPEKPMELLTRVGAAALESTPRE